MINQNEKLYAGIEAGGTKFNCVVGTSPTNILSRTQFPTIKPEQTLSQACDFFHSQANKYGDLSGMGIACFGPVDLDKESPTWGYITSTPKKHWSNTNVAGYFARELNIPVAFDTDVNGATLAEHRYGAARGVDDFVYVTIGTGIGGGVIANGKLVNGLMHTEIGHMLIPRLEGDSFHGICPFHQNCLTVLAAGPSIEARWNKPCIELPLDHEAWELESHYLAVMCVNIVMSLSPSRIILGGGVMGQMQLYPKIRKKFEKLMGGFMTPTISLDQYIIPPGLQGHSGEVGALCLAKPT